MESAREVEPAPAVRRNTALWAVCGLAILAFVVLRSVDLHLPADFSFDERHFVRNARRYLLGVTDQNDHPPLGKLLIAASISLLGDNALGWRFPSLLAGWVNIALAWALAHTIFRERLSALLAATLVAIDGFFLVYSRTALLDGPLVMLFLGSALASSAVVFRGKGVGAVAIAAVLAGLAMCVKFSGIVLAGPLVVALFAARHRLPRWAPALIALMPLAYYAVFAFALSLHGQPFGPLDVVADTQRLVGVHLGKSEWDNRWVSRWYTWFVPMKPVIMRWERDGEIVRTMTGMGNVALWWGASAALLAALWVTVRAGPRAWLGWLSGRVERGEKAWLLLLWICPLVPWMLTDRDAYLYHYLPCYAFGLVLVAGALSSAFRRFPKVAWAALVVVIVISLAFIPVWMEVPIERATWRVLLFVPQWR